eukprot:3849068-Amphidinium_carterae.1
MEESFTSKLKQRTSSFSSLSEAYQSICLPGGPQLKSIQVITVKIRSVHSQSHCMRSNHKVDIKSTRRRPFWIKMQYPQSQ